MFDRIAICCLGIGLLLLYGCGNDGEPAPQPPTTPQQPGISIPSGGGSSSGTTTSGGTSGGTSSGQTGTTPAPTLPGDPYEWISRRADNSVGDASASLAVSSDDGRWIAWTTFANGLVAADTNNFADIFLRDRQAPSQSAIKAISSNASGQLGNAPASFPLISANANIVVFASMASNLVTGDTNSASDIFAKDPNTGVIERLSVAPDGSQADFASQFLNAAGISADGRLVAFSSFATNLINDDTNDMRDVFVRDRQSGTTIRASIATDGTAGNRNAGSCCISADGSTVVFESEAFNLVTGDTDDWQDVFIRDLVNDTTTRISLASDGTPAAADCFLYGTRCLSANGRYIVFHSFAANLVTDDFNNRRDVFLHDRQTGETSLVSQTQAGVQGNGDSGNASISDDGRYVFFESLASNLVTGDSNLASDLFRKDTQTGELIRVSVTAAGSEANGASTHISINNDGSRLQFLSNANNLLTIGGTLRPGVLEVYHRNLVPGGSN